MILHCQKLHPNAQIPQYQSTQSAGADIYALLEEDLTIAHGQIVMIPTGLAFAVPNGYEMQIRARSGLASKGIIVPNAPGTIDADYRGEVKVLLLNLSGNDFVISPQMRIAQAIIAPVVQAQFEVAESLPSTERGEGGFGSTGLK